MSDSNSKSLKLLKKSQDRLNNSRSWAQFVNSLSGYKSANLLSTKSKDEKENLSIVSSTVHLGSNPPLLGFIIRPHSEDHPRHSFENLESTGYFTLNHVSEAIYKKAHQTSARYPKEVSEFNETGLTPEYRKDFFAPFVKESYLQMGMKHIKTYFIEENKTNFVIGEVLSVYSLEEALRADGSLDLKKINTVALAGLDAYYTTEELGRLSYAKPDKELEEL